MSGTNSGFFLDRQSGTHKRTAAIATSAGAGDAGKIIKLDSGGKLDTSFFPDDVLNGQERVMEVTETVTSGAALNFFNSSGTLKARLADGTDTTKPAMGFAKAGIASGQSGLVRLGDGLLTKTSHGFTIGAVLYLSTTPGAFTATPLSTAGQWDQRCGFVVDANTIYFEPEEGTEL